MNTNFNFKSQICTTRSQSETLLKLGLKKETADMVHFFSQSLVQDWTIVPLANGETARYIQGLEIPAWSLHRLISLTNTDDIKIAYNEKHCWGGNVLKIAQRKAFEKDNLYDNIIDCIEWLIKEGYFNKEYLV